MCKRNGDSTWKVSRQNISLDRMKIFCAVKDAINLIALKLYNKFVGVCKCTYMNN